MTSHAKAKKKDFQKSRDFSKAFMMVVSFMYSLSSTLKFAWHSFEAGVPDSMLLVLRLDTHPSPLFVFGAVKFYFSSSQSQLRYV